MQTFEHYLNTLGEVGFVETVTNSTVNVSGLPGVSPTEMVLFESGEIGEVLYIQENSVEILLLNKTMVSVGSRVVRTGEKLSVPVGKELMGLIMDPLGRVISMGSKTSKVALSNNMARKTLDMEALGIEKRTSIRNPLETGVAVVDMLVPLGKGQRELIIGDRKTGKTNFLLQTILRQTQEGTVCVYAAIGRKQNEIKEIEAYFKKSGIMDKVIIVAAGAQDPNGLIYLAPYTACAIAEHFRDLGVDSLVILDDLTTHARFYREICLLANRFPGRDSYPVDIFYAHAGMLEKGGNFRGEKGDVSITLLPCAETASGDLSGYIQTNLMSITDGHIYFDSDLFTKGRRPAVNPFLSVTRVGRQAQTPLKREINRELLAFLSAYEKLQGFVHFGAELTEEARDIISKGEKIIRFFDQKPDETVSSNVAAYILALIVKGEWSDKTADEAKKEFDNIVKDYRLDKNITHKVDDVIKQSINWKELIIKSKVI